MKVKFFLLKMAQCGALSKDLLLWLPTGLLEQTQASHHLTSSEATNGPSGVPSLLGAVGWAEGPAWLWPCSEHYELPLLGSANVTLKKQVE